MYTRRGCCKFLNSIQGTEGVQKNLYFKGGGAKPPLSNIWKYGGGGSITSQILNLEIRGGVQNLLDFKFACWEVCCLHLNTWLTTVKIEFWWFLVKERKAANRLEFVSHCVRFGGFCKETIYLKNQLRHGIFIQDG